MSLSNAATRDTGTAWRDALMHPQSVALLGISDQPGKLTGGTLRYLRRHGYAGTVYPVNPRHALIQGERSYADIGAVPGPVDHAYILLNTDEALAAIEACGRAGVRVVSLLAGGFAESGAAGARRQAELLAVVRAHGMRLVGPNSQGVVNYHTGMALTASPAFNRESLLPGRLMVISQSGAMVGTLVSRGFARGIGFSKSVSVGNEADLTVGHIGEAFVDDPQTRAFLLFLEAIRDAAALERFARAADAAGKPIVAYKLGRSEIGQELAVSHTGAMVGSDRAVDAFLRHLGIIRVDQLETLLELPALVVGRGPAPPRPRYVGVATTTGAGAALVVDRLGMLGVETRPPREASLAELARHGVHVQPGRVMDLTMAGTRYEAMFAALSTLKSAPEFDLILAVVGNSAEFSPERAVKPIADLDAAGKPLVAFLTPSADAAFRMLADAGVPAFRTPESCADAIRGFLAWRSPRPVSPPSDAVPAARAMLASCGSGVLDERGATRLLATLGIPTIAGVVLGSDHVPSDLAYPVVAKVLSPDIPHKTEAGGVSLDIATPEALRAAMRRIRQAVAVAKPDARIEGILVQPMIRGLAEALVGFRRDPDVGALVTLGAGGVLAEIYDDVAVRIAPVDEATAHEMIEEVKGLAVVRGYRNLPRGDLPALARAVAAMSRLAAIPEITEAEINPLLVRREGDGVVAVDALVATTRRGHGS